MDGIKTAVLTLCCGAMVCGVVQLIIPRGAMSRMMKTVTALFLMACVIFPILKVDFSQIDFDFTASEKSSSQLSQTVESQALSAAEKLLKETVSGIIGQKGYEPSELLVVSGRDQNGNIEIKQINAVVKGCGEQAAAELKQEIHAQTGVPAEVFN